MMVMMVMIVVALSVVTLVDLAPAVRSVFLGRGAHCARLLTAVACAVTV